MNLSEKYPQICLECKNPFMSKHIDTQYCSKRCKDKAWRNRNPRYNYEWFEQHLGARLEKNEKARLPEQKEKNRKHMREWYASHKTYYQQYRKLNHYKVKAQVLAHKVDVATQCEVCGSAENLERHHPDYSEPLIIVTVCRGCHVNIHKS